MKIVCTPENLRQGLQTTSRIISSSLTLPILNNVLLKTENGQLKISATNLEVGINTKIRCKIEQEGEVCVPAKTLTEVVNNLPNENISLETTEDAIAITSGSFSTKIKTFSADEFPMIPKIEAVETINLPGDKLKKSLDEVIFAASTSESQPEISGIYFAPQKNVAIFAATDRYRLSEKTMAGSFPQHNPIIIPHKAALEISRALTNNSGQAKLSITDNQVALVVEETEVVSRLIDGQYPDYSQIIPQEFKVTVKLSRLALVHALKTAGIFSQGTGSVELDYDSVQQFLKISSASHDVGESAIEIPGTVEGGNGKLFLNYRYMLDALNAMESEEIVIRIVDDSTAVIFQPAGATDYTYLIMPIKS